MDFNKLTIYELISFLLVNGIRFTSHKAADKEMLIKLSEEVYSSERKIITQSIHDLEFMMSDDGKGIETDDNFIPLTLSDVMDKLVNDSCYPLILSTFQLSIYESYQISRLIRRMRIGGYFDDESSDDHMDVDDQSPPIYDVHCIKDIRLPECYLFTPRNDPFTTSPQKFINQLKSFLHDTKLVKKYLEKIALKGYLGELINFRYDGKTILEIICDSYMNFSVIDLIISFGFVVDIFEFENVIKQSTSLNRSEEARIIMTNMLRSHSIRFDKLDPKSLNKIMNDIKKDEKENSYERLKKLMKKHGNI